MRHLLLIPLFLVTPLAAMDSTTTTAPDGNGGWTTTTERTKQNGKTVTSTRTGQVTKTDEGIDYTYDVTRTSDRGTGTSHTDGSAKRTDDGVTWSSTTDSTGAKGRERQAWRQGEATADGNGVDGQRQRQISSPAGERSGGTNTNRTRSDGKRTVQRDRQR